MEQPPGAAGQTRQLIVNAAMGCFGANGYKKASAGDIAAAAGVSKAMVFHYFGSKKKLYLYLLSFSGEVVSGTVKERFDPSVTDFFERILMINRIKQSIARQYPAMQVFLAAAYRETDDEVRAETAAFMYNARWEQELNQLIFAGIDYSKFKEGIDPGRVLKMLVLLGYGFLNAPPGDAPEKIDGIYDEYEEYMNLIRENFYKPECL